MPRGENRLIACSPNTIYSRWYPGSLRGDLWVERLRIIDLKAFLMASFLGGSTVGGWEQIVAMREHAFIRQGKQVSSRQKYLFQVFFFIFYESIDVFLEISTLFPQRSGRNLLNRNARSHPSQVRH